MKYLLLILMIIAITAGDLLADFEYEIRIKNPATQFYGIEFINSVSYRNLGDTVNSKILLHFETENEEEYEDKDIWFGYKIYKISGSQFTLKDEEYNWTNGLLPLEKYFSVRIIDDSDYGDYCFIFEHIDEYPNDTCRKDTIYFQISPFISVDNEMKDTVICPGTDYLFQIEATALIKDVTLNYQWRRNGNFIEGAVTNKLTITEAESGDSGNYDCYITTSDGNGFIYSEQMKITVVPDLQITDQSGDMQKVSGEPFSLSVTAEPVQYVEAYQWFKNDEPISGANGAELEVEEAVEATYYCDVYGLCETISSATISITLGGDVYVTILEQTADTLVFEDNEVYMYVSAEASNGAELSYQWYKNDQEIAQATGFSYTIDQAVLTDSGTYHVEISVDGDVLKVSDDILLTIRPIGVIDYDDIDPVIIKRTVAIYDINGAIVMRRHDNGIYFIVYEAYDGRMIVRKTMGR